MNNKTCDLGSVSELRWEEQAIIARINLYPGDLATIIQHIAERAPKKVRTAKFMEALSIVGAGVSGSRIKLVGDAVVAMREGVALKRIR